MPINYDVIMVNVAASSTYFGYLEGTFDHVTMYIGFVA